MKFFITALILMAFGANVYSQNNTKITLKCGVTPMGQMPLWIMVFRDKTFVLKNEYTKAINPNTIEAINVTKNDAEAAIYGVRGAYGVVTIRIMKKFARKEFKRLKPYLEKL